MGGGQSRQSGTNQPFILPADAVPYQGPILQYAFKTNVIQLRGHFTFSYTPSGENIVTSNIDEFYPSLAQNYNEGFRLVQFLKTPYACSSAGMFSMSVQVPYQAVYCRVYTNQPQINSWQLKIEKSIIYMYRLSGGMLFSLRQGFAAPASDLSHMYEIIKNNAAVGGRFVCMEQTGTVQSQGVNMAMSGVSPGMGTDLFFNMPLHPNPVIYTYMAISVPIPVKLTIGTGGGSIDMVCDWMGTLSQYLNQGWRLVDIYMDDVEQISAFYNRGPNRAPFPLISLNSIWFFEKELSKLDDATQLYEGTVIEYYLKTRRSIGSISSEFNITQLCQEMGNRGWKLTCLLQTPKVVRSGFNSATAVILLIFQRRLRGPISAPLPEMQVAVEGSTGATTAPRSYNSVIGTGQS